jgi:hypothetical protein
VWTVNIASRRFPKSLIVPGAALFAASVTAFFLLVRAVGLGGYDLSVYLLGGRAYMQGMPVYDQQMHSEWGVGYFTYPPVTLLLFRSHVPATGHRRSSDRADQWDRCTGRGDLAHNADARI